MSLRGAKSKNIPPNPKMKRAATINVPGGAKTRKPTTETAAKRLNRERGASGFVCLKIWRSVLMKASCRDAEVLFVFNISEAKTEVSTDDDNLQPDLGSAKMPAHFNKAVISVRSVKSTTLAHRVSLTPNHDEYQRHCVLVG